MHEELRCYLLHGLEQSLSVVLEGHDQLQLGASGFHGWGGNNREVRTHVNTKLQLHVSGNQL